MKMMSDETLDKLAFLQSRLKQLLVTLQTVSSELNYAVELL